MWEVSFQGPGIPYLERNKWMSRAWILQLSLNRAKPPALLQIMPTAVTLASLRGSKGCQSLKMLFPLG